MRRNTRAVLLALFLTVGFCCAVGMAASLVVSYIAPYVDGVDV